MTNYTKTTNFAVKDLLPEGDSGKVIRGAEFDTEFNNIATAVATKADTSYVDNAVNDLEGFYINVKDYGATGDGETDDTAAIQAALNAGEDNTVFFPQGTYIISSPLQVNRIGTKLQGVSMVGSNIKTSSVAHDAIVVNAAYSAIEDMQIVAGVDSGTFQIDTHASSENFSSVVADGNGNKGIYYPAERAHHVIRNVQVQKFQHGIQAKNNVFAMTMDNVRSTANDINFWFNNVLCITLNNCYGSNAYTRGVNIKAGRQIVFNGFNSGSTGGNGSRHVDIGLNSYGVIFNGGNFEKDDGLYAPDDFAIRTSSTSRGIIFNGVQINKPQATEATGSEDPYTLFRFEGNSEVIVNQPTIVSPDPSGSETYRAYSAVSNAKVTFNGKGNLPDNAVEASSERVLDTDYEARKFLRDVAFRAGSADILDDKVNSLTTSDTFTLPAAADYEDGYYIIIEKADYYKDFDPVLSTQTGDKIRHSGGDTDTYTMDFDGAQQIRFVSDGETRWII